MKKAIAALALVFIFLVPVISGPAPEERFPFSERASSVGDNFVPSDWQDANSGKGDPLLGNLNGLRVTSGTSVIDYSHSAYIGINPPLGWSSEQLEGQLEHLSMWVDDVLVNPNLDAYHEEHWFMTANPEYNYDPFYVPDGWTIVKFDASGGTQHPQHGIFEMNAYSGNGYDNSWGWRFDANPSSGTTFNPSNQMYISQQIPIEWRSVYSAEVTFRYYVSSTSILDDDVYIFTRVEDYISKNHVFVSSTPMDTWLQATNIVPTSAFQSMENLGSMIFDIGLGTDITGLPGSSVHEVYIDEIELRLQVRPFPDQIDLRANGAQVTGSTQKSISPYVPDGSNRDCYSAIDSNGGSGGVDLNGYGNNGWLDVGGDVPTTFGSDWSDAFAYQVGLQFRLYVPQGAAIESSYLRVEAASDSTSYPGMRVYAANEDNIAAFTSGYPLLPDRYDWVNTSVYWRPTTWTTNGRYDTPDISALIQEVVSRPGWQSGNYICLMIDYAYSNQQYAYNQIKGSSGFAQADLARLFVDYIDPDPYDTIPSFKFNKNIMIDHTKVVSDLQDFPILVNIWDEDLHFNAQPDGDDIAFLYNSQVIPYDLELFDKQGNGTHAHLICWVKAPHLSSVEDTTIVMVYGDEDVGSQEDPENVWNSDYSAVWHLNDNPAQPQWDSTYTDYLPHQPQIIDSTVHGLDGSTYVSMTSSDSVSGQIGNAIDLDGVDDFVDFGNPAELQMTGAFTVEAWFNADFIDNDYLVVKSGETNYRGWDISFDDDPTISPAGWVMFRYSPDGVNTELVGYERVDTGQWYHVVGVFNPSVYARFYLNGELVDEVTTGVPASAYDPPNRPARIGRRSDNPGGTSYLDAIVDEVRISNIARSDSWIRTQYINQRNPELFLTVGDEGVNFRYMKDITIDHTKVASDLTGFPLLIDIYDSDLRTNVQLDGDDIMFTSNGRNLPHEIELFNQQYNSTHAHLVAWVRVDLSSISDTVITMYYSNPAMGSQENPLEVWRNQYQGVWHLGNDPSSALPAPQITDSTENGNDGTTYGTMTQSDQVIGHIGNALDFDGSNDYVDCGNTISLTVGYNDFAMSVWFASTDLDVPLAMKGAIGTNAYRYMLSITSSGTVKAEIDDNSVTPGKITIYSASALNDGFWHYAVMVRSGSWLHLYIDGSEVPTSPVDITGYGSINSVEPFLIAACDNYDNVGAPNLFTAAQIDEVRVLHDTITTQWILTEYNNQFDPSGFYSIGIEQEVIIPKEAPLSFLYKKDITIDHAKVISDVTGFPVLIDLYDTDLRLDVQADGDDIVFVKDGWILPHEIELFEQFYNSSHAHLIAWVRMDLSSTSDTVFSIYYGNPYSSSYEDPEGVWDTSFAAVWHLSEDPAGTIFDSTANGNDGIGLSSGSGPTLQVGIIYGCSEFYGETTKDRIEVAHSSSLVLQSDMLVEAWVRTSNADPTSDTIVAKWGDVGHRNYWLGKLDASTLAFYVDNTQSVTAAFNLVNDGEWHHIVGVADAASGDLFLYIDGIERGNALYSGSTQTGTSMLQIANNPGSTGFIQEWDGRIDEVRVSSSHRSIGWIQTEFNNQKNPASFFTTGSEVGSAPLNFDYRKDITIDHTKVSADLTDFPLLIDIFDADLRTKVQSDGDDIIFKSGESILPHEIEVFEQAYNGSHAHLLAWVKADLMSSTDTIITMYYGNPTIGNQENAAGVWDSNYKGVWHLGEDPTGTVYDSTSNSNDGTGINLQSDDQVDGQIDGSIDFDNTMDFIDCGGDTSLNVGSNDFSLSLWFKYDGVNMGVLAGKGAVLMAKRYRISIESGPGMLMANIDDDTVAKSISSTLTYGDNLWHHVSMVRDGNYLRLYIDGVEDLNSPIDITGYGSLDEDESFYINAFRVEVGGTVGYWSTASIDEVRLVKMVLSPDWIAAEYTNQFDPNSFYSIGAEISAQSIEFAFKKDVVIDHTKVQADLTDFPLLVDIFDVDLRTKVQSDGDDIVFAINDAILPHELELFDQTYNSTHAHLVAWVKVDLQSSIDTVVTMYYGNPTIGNLQNPAEVWDSNFTMVHHLNGLSGTHYDSTGNNHDGISFNFNGDEPTSGKIDGAYNFDGINDAINLSMSHPQLYDDFTLSGWYKSTDASLSDDQYIWNHLEGYTETGIVMGVTDDDGEVGHIRLSIYDNSYNFHPYYGTSNIVDQEYHFIVMVRDTGSIKLYVDGNLELDTADLDTGETITVDASAGPFMGDFPGDTEQVKGVLDEIRVSTIGRSINWILTEFNNQNDPASFYTIGEETRLQVEYQPDVQTTDFKYRKDLVVDHTKVGVDLVDFPMLIDIYDTDLRTDVQADGDDIMFKRGYIWCPHEIELFEQTYNSTHAHLVAWVKTDLSSSVDTTITMYYGNSIMTSREDSTAVWNENYVGVWHLGETAGGSSAIKDSTLNLNHGTDSGSPTLGIVGAVGNAIAFDGINDMINCGNGPSLTISGDAMTIEAWAYLNEDIAPQWGTGIAYKEFSYSLIQDWDASRRFTFEMNADARTWTSDTNKDLYRWYHVVGVYDGTNTYIYVDGFEISSAANTGNIDATAFPLYIGKGDPDFFNGRIDEVRILNIDKSAEWIATEFRNQNNPSSFYSIGSEEEISGKGYIFTTNSKSSVTIGAKLSLGVQTPIYSYANDFTLGTSFSITNGSLPIWTAGVLVSPPSELDAVSFEISYPDGEWWPFSVKSPSGVEKTFSTDWTCYNGKLIVGSTAIDEYGMWKIQFLDRNHVFDMQMGPSGGPYSTTDQFTIGEDIQFRVWGSGTIGSTISLELTDSSGSTWYTGSTTIQGQRFTLPYYHRKYLTIAYDSVAEDLVNFPVLLDIYDTDLRTDVRADGRDIAFTIGERTLSHEIELFDQTYNLTHAHLIAWVNVPLLSGSTDTMISMYYGNPLAPIVYDSGPVWDSGYLGVWHLSESGTGALDEYLDSSQYKNHGQGGEGNSSFVPTQTVGKIGSGQDFNNLDGYYDLIDCGDSPLWNIDGYQITLEAWVQHDITPNTHVYGIMNHKGWYDGYALYVNYGGGSTIKPTFALPGQTHQLVGANDVTGGTWHQIVATYDGSLMRIFVDGVQDPNILSKTDAILPSAYEQGFWIGHGDQPKDKLWSAEWDGQIDEVRISDVVRSAGWIQTQFENQYDPSNFYSVGIEETIGYSESASINLDTSVPAGVWYATARYSDTSSDVIHRAGMFARSFTVKRGTSLNLIAPGDAIGDGISTKLVGEQLYVEFELEDSLNTGSVSGATVSMNWSVTGIPTQVQFNDYGDGRYGKTLNTSDLGSYGRWRLDLQTSHPFYTDATDYFYLDLSHRTFLTYEPPPDAPYGDDFEIRLTLKDQFDNAPLTGATISCNATILGTPTDYGNGTYLVTVDSVGFSIGEHTFRFTATPSTSYLLSSNIDVQFTYRPIATDAAPLSPDPVEAPWGQQVNTSIYLYDVDHAGIGVEGASVSIAPFVQTQTFEAGSGYYGITIDVSSFTPGTYFFDLTCSKLNYQSSVVTISITILTHRTTPSVDYNSTIPVGTDTYFDISWLDLDLDSILVGSGNLSQVSIDWGTGSTSFAAFSFWLDTSGWVVGSYTINVTINAITSPRFYMDSYIIVQLEIRKLNVYLSWEPLEPFPNGDDFVLFVHVNVSEPNSPIDSTPIAGLDQTYFSARNETGGLYTFESFANLGNGLYQITIDSSRFLEGQYKIIIYIDFQPTENYIDTNSPQISFTYRPILTYLSSPNYPTVTTSFDTNVTITLSYVDIDNSQNITIGTITSEGALIVWEHIGNGIYEVLIVVQGWDLGAHEVNLTADASSYQAKTLTFQILVQIAYAYARSSVSIIDLPVGDTAVFYADYWDITHDEPILGATIDHNWIYPLTISWTGDQYRIELPSEDIDGLGSYLVIFNFSKGPNYQFGYFNISIILRTHLTEFRLASAIEPTSYNAMVNISVYCGDLDNDAGIIDAPANLSVYGDLGWIPSTYENDTVLGNGYYIIRFPATNLGPSGLFELTIYFNWTGPIQKYYDGSVMAFVKIIGEASELSLIDSAGPTPFLNNLTYTYLYNELYSGNGISNISAPAGNVFIYVEFVGFAFSPSLFTIIEDSGNPGYYSIEFNSTMFEKPGIYVMIVYVNWSKGVDPGYDNRTDSVSVRIIPRNTLVNLIPPESTPYGVNATFSFSFDDVAESTTERIPFGSQMDITIGLPDYSITYSSSTKQFHVSFNTSVLGSPLGSRQFTISISWSGSPYYANVTGRIVIINVRYRETEFDYSAISPTAYGDNATLHVSYTDITLGIPQSIDDGTVTLFNGSLEIPVSEYSVIFLGNGEYDIELKTTYFSKPGTYSISVRISTTHFYYATVTASRSLNLRYRLTVLLVEPVADTPYNNSLEVVFHYSDTLSLVDIGNTSTPTTIRIMNGSSWLFSSVWRGASEDYLLTIQTYNQVLEINREYVLWIEISYPDSSPFYLSADAFISFTLRERATNLELIASPEPTQYLENINFTAFYQDSLSLNGIAGATITLTVSGVDLVEGMDYILQNPAQGIYHVSLNTTALGSAGTTISLVFSASWISDAPYYSTSTLSLSLSVTQRESITEILASTTLVKFLENVTFTIRYSDVITGKAIQLSKDQLLIYSKGTLLQSSDFSMSYLASSYEVSINSSILNIGLVSNWNITFYFDWQDGAAPYYSDGRASAWVTVVNRIGIIIRGTTPTVPIHDNMTLGFTYVDDTTGVGINDAIVIFDCLSPSGLVEGLDFWIFRNAGDYSILVNTTSLGSTGTFTFSLRLLWNPTVVPYYRNTTTVFLQGSVRLIQVQLTNEEPDPQTVPVNDNVSVVLHLQDSDHALPISGAEASFSVVYKTNASGPASWSITPISPGVYELVVDCFDAGVTGTNALIITLSLSDYQTVQVQVPFQIRLRQGELDEITSPGAFYGEATYVIVELVDTDADNTPISDAILIITWPDVGYTPDYTPLGNGQYIINLTTASLDAGLYSLVVSAQKSDYFIADISVPVQIRSIPTELILPQTIPDVYWGDDITLWAMFNDTRDNILISGANLVYKFGVLSGSLSEVILDPGNYSFTADTGNLATATTYVVSITATLKNYVTITKQVIVNVLKLPVALTLVSAAQQQVYKGSLVNITVYVNNTYSNTPLLGAIVTATYIYLELHTVTLYPVPGKNGYYGGLIDTSNLDVRDYVVSIRAGGSNYLSVSTSASITVLQIKTVLLLDNLTSTYSTRSFNWSDTIRIGVYVLAPSLNLSLADCIVRWSLSGTTFTGEFLNGTSIGGLGYFYYDFETWDYDASTYTLRITAYPNIPMFAYSNNLTTLIVEPIQTSVESTYLSPKIWGWTGWINLTYWDLLFDRGIAGASVVVDWDGDESIFSYYANGTYQIFINTSLVSPGIHPVSIRFIMENYRTGTGVFTLTVREVPTGVAVFAPEINKIDGDVLDLRVPYGDVLPLVLFYNDTWYNRGIPGATEMTGVILVPGHQEADNLLIEELAFGNYSLMIDTTRWQVSPIAYEVVLRFYLANWSRATIKLQITIINLPTDIQVDGLTSLTLSYGQYYSIWVFYYDNWTDHAAEGIAGGSINATSLNLRYVKVLFNQSDLSRPGWYEIRVRSQWTQGSTIISIILSKENCDSARIVINISVEPSEVDILISRVIIYGFPIGIILLVGALLWSRLFSVPKRLREIRGMVKTISKGKIPKPPENVPSRQEIVADLFNDVAGAIGITKTASSIPSEAITTAVPEIEELLVQLSILTKLNPEELEDFKFDVSKMKLSEQVNFVKEVINQEAIKQGRLERKPMELILEETAAKARAILAGEEIEEIIEPKRVEERVELGEVEEPKKIVPEPVEFEEVVSTDVLSEDELKEIRKRLTDAGIKGSELETIMDQARELPRELAEELLKSILGKGGEDE